MLKNVLEGTTAWPKANLIAQKFDCNLVGKVSREGAIIHVNSVFEVMGDNCANVAVLSGYWDTELPEKELVERAERLCRHWRE